MSTLIIIVLVLILTLLVCGFLAYRYIKRKIRNKLIDKGAELVSKAATTYLNEEAAKKVNNVTGDAAEAIKSGGAAGLTMMATKKGLEYIGESQNGKA